ncbi:hypothetical protein EAS61_28935 [Bradyrhizobium zhanjiangense]|uniref:Uncharacterized protein n=1 Tax=Bradyrhizobium zhanjiangense TaxID=1325107 RepID=A0A4Q0QEJ4_9BRAD|nr:hypothetical protein EAS61_28935 [Bradyrhizobium zhanjiangense]RXG96396.1 hypothetical protein EAS62_12520 [Bradyrhizobium zhanjiangense]
MTSCQTEILRPRSCCGSPIATSGGRPQKRTLANLSKLPWEVIEALKTLLKGGTLLGGEPRELSIERSLPRGHVAAVLGMIRKIRSTG